MSQLFGGYFDVDEYNNSTKKYHIKKIGLNENKDLIAFLDKCHINVDVDDLLKEKKSDKDHSDKEDSDDISLDESILIKNDDELDSSIVIKTKKNVSFDLNDDINLDNSIIVTNPKGKGIEGGKKEIGRAHV